MIYFFKEKNYTVRKRRNLAFLLLLILTLVGDPDGGLHAPPAAVPAHTTQEEVDTSLGGGLGGEG